MAKYSSIKRGYIRHSARYPGAEQRKALEAAGVKVIYDETRGEGRAKCIDALRAGDVLVVDGLHRLGVNRPDLVSAFEMLGEKGVEVEDARTGEKVSARVMFLALDALREIAGERKMPSRAEAIRRGKKGGRPKAARMPARDAAKIWRDWVKYPTAEDALAHMPGWSKRQAYRSSKEGGLGSRGAPAGRRPTEK